jgi:hypothetical protein
MGIYLDPAKLRKDDVYVANDRVKLSTLTGMPNISGLDDAIVSNGKIVNVVSEKYGHLSNENFFKVVEKRLDEAGIKYLAQYTNRDDVSFAAEYILHDDTIAVQVKNGQDDTIRPMMRFTNAYDGSVKIAGQFGFYRQVCTNGLHVAEKSDIGFTVRRRGDVEEVVIERIGEMIHHFIENEYTTLRRKFDVLAERPIKDLKNFVRSVSLITGVLSYSASEKNPDKPSKNAKIVMETIDTESKTLHTRPNMWLGYNAFNAFIHGTNKPFQEQSKLDNQVFNLLYNMQANGLDVETLTLSN